MTARTADNGIKAVFQLHDEIITAAFLRDLDDLFIRGIWLAVADVFHDCFIEQVIVLRNIGDIAVVFLQRKLMDIRAADFNTAGGCIPEGRDQLGNGGLAAAGVTDDCIDAASLQFHADTVQNFLFVIAEMHVLKRDGIICRNCGTLLRTLKLRLCENARNLADNYIDFAKIIRIGHNGNNRPDDAERQNDAQDKVRKRKRSVNDIMRPKGKHRKQRIRRYGHCQPMVDGAVLHPVNEGISLLPCCLCKF